MCSFGVLFANFSIFLQGGRGPFGCGKVFFSVSWKGELGDLFGSLRTSRCAEMLLIWLVGVIIGGAFGKVVTELVDGVLMPPIGLLIGG